MKKAYLYGIAAGAMICAAGQPALAQQEEVDASAESPNTIVVTAQRVEQDIQDVPISVTSIGADDLSVRQIDSFEQLQYVAPGISFNAGVNARQSATIIRGIGTSLFNSGIEGSTAIVVDGVVLGREGAGLLDFSDLERVEVLRGPQGTLFGKNASAGVVSFVTKNPTDELTVDASASYGSLNEVNLSGAISGPVSDGISARISGFMNRRDGIVENINPDASQTDLNNRNDFGFRGKLAIDLGGGADLVIGADYSQRDDRSGALTARSFSDGSPGTGIFGTGIPLIPSLATAAGITASPENDQIASEGDFFAEAEVYGIYVEASIPVGDHELVSLTSYRGWESRDNNDADLVPQLFLEVNSGDLTQEQFSQEFRLVSPQEERLRYLLGAFAFVQEVVDRQEAIGTFGFDALGLIPPGTTTGSTMNATTDETNLALFGQGEFDATDNLTLIAGLRLLYSDVSSTMLRQQVDSAPSGAIVVGPRAFGPTEATPLTAGEDDVALVWRLGAKLQPNENTNFFATVTRGYKSAGTNTSFDTLETSPGSGEFATVAPEIPTQFELGVRSRTSDGRLTANLTGFYTIIDDFQAQSLVPTDSGATGFSVVNAGSVETYGFEAELTVIPIENFTLSGTVAYTKATYQDFDQAECYASQTEAEGCMTDADGNRFQNLDGVDLGLSPDWIMNFVGRYDFDDIGSARPFAQVGLQYRSETLSSNNGNPDTLIDAYALLDAQIGTTLWDGTATLTVFGRNLTDQNFATAIVPGVFDDGGTAQFVTVEARRTFGVRLAVQY
ncbi:MAG: TonB-dependent receptor [Erythrobacter sp.]|uniref:TonB-dependent receptor n=1 Tax=Erythrobacter sp. TaxID=1042 RepID=UPI00261CEB4B|nr:TonB-dependent receptor [Erythrobacter sp.]MDJ0977303.1 TonB-dependent receptor [Erythrobacter sp.]